MNKPHQREKDNDEVVELKKETEEERVFREEQSSTSLKRYLAPKKAAARELAKLGLTNNAIAVILNIEPKDLHE